MYFQIRQGHSPTYWNYNLKASQHFDNPFYGLKWWEPACRQVPMEATPCFYTVTTIISVSTGFQKTEKWPKTWKTKSQVGIWCPILTVLCKRYMGHLASKIFSFFFFGKEFINWMKFAKFMLAMLCLIWAKSSLGLDKISIIFCFMFSGV